MRSDVYGILVAGVLILTSCGGSSFPDPVPDECITHVSAGYHRFDCDGVVHEITMPPDCMISACGIIVDAHGATMPSLVGFSDLKIALFTFSIQSS